MITGRRLRSRSEAPPPANRHAGVASLPAALSCPASGGAVCVLALASLIVVIGTTSLSAHRRDELLQAARIGIGADRIELELSLTPGMAIADERHRRHRSRPQWRALAGGTTELHGTCDGCNRALDRRPHRQDGNGHSRRIRCSMSCAAEIARSSFDRRPRFPDSHQAATRSLSPTATAATSASTWRTHSSRSQNIS